MNASRPEASLGNREPFAFAAEQVLGRNADVVVMNLRMPTTIHVPKHVRIAANDDAGCVQGYRDHRLLEMT